MARLVHKSRKNLLRYGPKEVTCSTKRKGCGETKPSEAFTMHTHGKSGFKYNDIYRECQRANHNARDIPKKYIKKAKENYIRNNPEKINAHKIASELARRGIIQKEPCIICGEERIVSVHHYDGNKKNNSIENLIPLCPTHHLYFHSKYRHLIEKKILQYITRFKKSKK